MENTTTRCDICGSLQEVVRIWDRLLCKPCVMIAADILKEELRDCAYKNLKQRISIN